LGQANVDLRRRIVQASGASYHWTVPTVAEVRALLDAFTPGSNGRAARSLARVRELLDRVADPFARTMYEPGHLTASGVVLSPDRGAVLLVYHRRLRRWLQPGGHIEAADPTVAAAARREVLEETGIDTVPDTDPVLVGVDVHEIPAARGEPSHWHHDLAVAFHASDTRLNPAEEIRDAVWCAVGELDRYEVDDALRASVKRALHLGGTAS
jgi:8-oxo-dGTP pyrophosphatase MutT (NUDIX family)